MMERAGLEPATSGLQTQPGTKHRPTPTNETGVVEPIAGISSYVSRRHSTALCSHRACTIGV